MIFIEGISENVLINSFISKYDEKRKQEEQKKVKKEGALQYVPLAAQNLTILQVGANAKSFRYFLELLKIPALIITDIDTARKISGKNTYYKASAVEATDSCYTSNATINYYFNAPKVGDPTYKEWYEKLLSHKLHTNSSWVSVSYQKKEKGYYPRSFEDAFISLNIELVKEQKENLWGLKCTDKIDTENNMYVLTQKIIDKKSDFASSILFTSHTKNVMWETPAYITEGIEWLQKQLN